MHYQVTQGINEDGTPQADIWVFDIGESHDNLSASLCEHASGHLSLSFTVVACTDEGKALRHVKLALNMVPATAELFMNELAAALDKANAILARGKKKER